MKNPILLKKEDTNQIIELLLWEKICILPTDTIYGLHCLANKPNLISKIYDIKDRPTDMPMIRLISDPSDLEIFDIQTTEFEKEQINNLWPGPNTLIFNNNLHQSISFRVPKNDFLLKILRKTGPLISTSANKHKSDVVKDIESCIKVFGNQVDFYVDGGLLNNSPSKIYKFENGEMVRIR